MKKVLALVLAVAMMATVAFAADSAPATYVPGEEIKLGCSDFGGTDNLNTKNYSIKKVTYDKGKAYVESIVLSSDEDEDKLTVTLKTDYSLVTKNDAGKAIDVTVELKAKGREIDVLTAKKVLDGDVGFGVDELQIDNEGYVDVAAGLMDEDSRSVAKIIKAADDNETPYGTMEFTAIDGDTDVSVRVYDGDKFFLGQNRDSDKKVLIANADADAEISFLNFVAKPSFNSTATVYFYQVDEDGFVYELTGEGKIKKSAAKWSEDDGCWVLKTRTLGSYVFSDKELASAAAADDTTTNPDTGANDVVGIATALAVVSLVAAGAVSLKK